MKFETNISDVILRTYNVKSFRMPRPALFSYKPGQFMFITIKKGKKKMTKHFTISSSPTEKEFLEFTKKLTGHEFSNALDNLKKGDWIEINGPYGDFYFEGEYPKVGMLTGGIGITPIRSMIKFCTDVKNNSNIVLLYSNRLEKDIAYRKEFELLQKLNSNLRIIFSLTAQKNGWKGYSRRIDKEMVEQEIPDFKERVFFTCGPPGLVASMEKLLILLDLDKKNIRKENFPGY